MTDDHTLVTNHEELVSVFGKWPSFHDAEVLSLSLDRSGPGMDLSIYVFAAGPAVDARGYFLKSNEARVTLRFDGISDLSLSGFNEQNVLSDLRFVKEPDGTKVLLDDIYGLTGSFRCSSVEVRQVEQWKPEQR